MSSEISFITDIIKNSKGVKQEKIFDVMAKSLDLRFGGVNSGAKRVNFRLTGKVRFDIIEESFLLERSDINERRK